MNDKTHRDPEAVKKLVQWLGEGHQALAELVDVLHGSIDELEQKNRALTQQITDLSAQRDVQEQEKRAQKIRELEEKEQTQARRIQELEEKEEAQSRMIRELEQRADTADRALEQEKQTLKLISDRRDELDVRAAGLTKQLEDASAETERLNSQVAEQKTVIDTLTARIETLTHENAAMKNIIENRGFGPFLERLRNFKRNS